MSALESLANVFNKYGLFPAVALLALCLGGYGCLQAKDNERQIQQLAIEQVRTDSKLDTNTKELTDRMSGVEKSLVELTTQIKLLVEGKINVGGEKK